MAAASEWNSQNPWRKNLSPQHAASRDGAGLRFVKVLMAAAAISVGQIWINEFISESII